MFIFLCMYLLLLFFIFYLCPGITNCVGRILAGWIADLPQVSSLLVNNVSLLMAAIATAIFPFCTSYTLLIVVACFFGVGIGMYSFLCVRRHWYVQLFVCTSALVCIAFCVCVGIGMYSFLCERRYWYVQLFV